MKTYKLLIHMVLLALVAVVFSCEKEEGSGRSPLDGGGGKLTISCSLPAGLETDKATMPTDAEKTISNLCVLFFDNTTNGFIGTTCVESITGSDASSISFDLPSGVSIGGTYKMVFLANAKVYIEGLMDKSGVSNKTWSEFITSQMNGKLYSDINAQLYLYSSSSNGAFPTPLPMVGEVANQKISSSSAISISFRWLMAKVRVEADASLTSTGYSIEGFYVSYGATSAGPIADPNYNAVLSSAQSGMQNSECYLFPRAYASVNPAFLVLKVKKNADGSCSNHKVTLNPAAGIKAGYLYMVKVYFVLDDGTSSTSNNPLEGKLGCTVNSWLGDFRGVSANSNGNILAASSGSVLLTGTTSQNVLLSLKGVSFSDYSNPPIWLNISKSGDVITFEANGENTTESSRSQVITVTAGSLFIPITVTQLTKGGRTIALTNYDPDKLVFGPAGGKYSSNNNGNSITVAAANGATWSAEVENASTHSWVVLDKGTNTLDITVNPYTAALAANDPTTRTATVTISTTDGLTHKLAVMQNLVSKLEVKKGSGDDLTPDYLLFDCDGVTNRTFKVNDDNSGWNVSRTSGSTDFTVSQNSATSSFTVTVPPQEVFGAPERSATITVTGNSGKSYSFTVTQEPVVVAANDESVLVTNGTVYISNRNVGAAEPGFYSNKVEATETNKPVWNNLYSKGEYVSSSACPNGWRVPTLNEINTLVSSLKSAIKTIGSNSYNIFYVDGLTSALQKRRVFFVLSGNSTSQADNSGYYWFNNSGTYNVQKFSPDKTNSQISPTAGVNYSLRCVKSSGAGSYGNTVGPATNNGIIPAGGGSSEVVVDAASWTAECNNTAFKLARSGNKLRISADKNYGAEVSGTVTVDIVGVNNDPTFPIKQAKNLSAAPTELNLDCHYDYKDFALNLANATPDAKKVKVEVENANWLKVSFNNGIVNGDVYSPEHASLSGGIAASSKDVTAQLNTMYVHADENLTGAERSATVKIKDCLGADIASFVVKQSKITNVGKFGDGDDNNAGTTDDPYSTMLGVENTEEGNTTMAWGQSGNSPFTDSRKGLKMLRENLNNVSSSSYPAINYCAKKNKDTDKNGVLDDSEVKWYLPAQEQLMGVYVARRNTNLSGLNHWSATAFSANDSWFVQNGTGYTNYITKNDYKVLRCVRDVQ